MSDTMQTPTMNGSPPSSKVGFTYTSTYKVDRRTCAYHGRRYMELSDEYFVCTYPGAIIAACEAILAPVLEYCVDFSPVDRKA